MVQRNILEMRFGPLCAATTPIRPPVRTGVHPRRAPACIALLCVDSHLVVRPQGGLKSADGGGSRSAQTQHYTVGKLHLSKGGKLHRNAALAMLAQAERYTGLSAPPQTEHLVDG